MRNLIQATAHVWDAPTRRQPQRQVIISSLVFAGAWLALFIAAGLVSVLDVVPGGLVATFAIQVTLSSLAWLVISLRLPDRRRSWTDLLPGCLLFGLGLSLDAARRAASTCQHDSSTRQQLYGSLGVAAVILVWLLLLGHLTVISALVNRVWFDYRVDREQQAAAATSASDVGGDAVSSACTVTRPRSTDHTA